MNVKYFSILPEKHVPWHYTIGIMKIQATLHEAYAIYCMKSSLHYNPDLKTFLDSNASDLLKKYESGDYTNISLNSVDPQTIRSNEITVNLQEIYLSNIFPKKSGVYIIQGKDSSQYVGSSIDFSDRIFKHYKNFQENVIDHSNAKLYMYVRKNGITSLQWYPVKFTINYFTQFVQDFPKYSNNKDIRALLTIFTLYECRAMEQALILTINPSLNGNKYVAFNNTWSLNNLRNINYEGIPIKAITKEEEVYNYVSVNSASKLTNIDRWIISIFINSTEYLYSSTLNKEVRFFNENIPIKAGHPMYYDDMANDPNINYDSIPIKHVQVYDTDYNLVGTFDSINKAAKAIGVSSSRVRYAANKLFINTFVNGVQSLHIFARRLEEKEIRINRRNSQSIIIKDTIKNQSFIYDSIKSAVIAMQNVEIKRISTYFRRKYLDTGVLYKNRFLLYKTNSFSEPYTKGPSYIK